MSKVFRTAAPSSLFASLPEPLIQIIMTFIEVYEAYLMFSSLSHRFAKIPVACHTLVVKHEHDYDRLFRDEKHRFQFHGLVRAVFLDRYRDAPVFKNLRHMTIRGSYLWTISSTVLVSLKSLQIYVESQLEGEEVKSILLSGKAPNLNALKLIIASKNSDLLGILQALASDYSETMEHFSIIDNTRAKITEKEIALIKKLVNLQTLELEDFRYPFDAEWDLSNLKNLLYTYIRTWNVHNENSFGRFVGSIWTSELELSTLKWLPVDLSAKVISFLWAIADPLPFGLYTDSLSKMRDLTIFQLEIYQHCLDDKASERIHTLVVEVDSMTNLDEVFNLRELRHLTITALNTSPFYAKAEHHYVDWILFQSQSPHIFDERLVQSLRRQFYRESKVEDLVLQYFVFVSVTELDLRALLRDALPEFKQLTLKHCYFQRQ